MADGDEESRKRKLSAISGPASPGPASSLPRSTKKSRVSDDKSSKGLRHFSMKVCQKVQEKQVTTYNEVADELVMELSDTASLTAGFDQKNIRRRVYDALNVLMAMDIISKEKKQIKWIGLPTNSLQECVHLEADRSAREDRIRKKRAHLQELILQQVAVQGLVNRNAALLPPNPTSLMQLPFIIINTRRETEIECQMSEDRCDYFFNFSHPFEIHDDLEILKRMGLAGGITDDVTTPAQMEAAIAQIPPDVVPYLRDMVKCVREPATATNKAGGGSSSSSSSSSSSNGTAAPK